MNWTRLLVIIISLTIATFLGSCELDNSPTINYPGSDDEKDPLVNDCEVVVNYPHSATTYYIGGQHTINITPNTQRSCAAGAVQGLGEALHHHGDNRQVVRVVWGKRLRRRAGYGLL